MKILQIVPYFFVDWAGGKRGKPIENVYGLSKALVQRNHEVTIFTTDAFNKKNKMEYQSEPFYLEKGLRVFEFKSLSLLNADNIIVSWNLATSLAKEIRKFDVVHLHEYRTYPNVIAHHYAKKWGIPYVTQANGSMNFFQKGMLKRTYDVLWGHNVLKDASILIASTQAEAEQYKALGADEGKIEIVPYGINLSDFIDLPGRGNFRGKYGLNENDKVILFLGRIHKIKGLDLLINAFVDIANEIDGSILVIAGPDLGHLIDLKMMLKKSRIEKRVIFTGPLYGTNKLEAYVDADVYVLPSIYESFSVTSLEACACGTPVILTDCCGIASEINNKAGISIPRNEKQLKDALLYLLGNMKKREEFGENGKVLVNSRFNWSKVAERMESIYSGMLKTSSVS